MLKILRSIYRFLPVQLFLLHFRKYQLLLIFWVILFASISGHFASHYGAASLFLSPEYLGKVGFGSMFFLGCGMAVFFMSWQISTYIIHSTRIPYMGVIRHSFLLYCLNNIVLPLGFVIYYSFVNVGYHRHFEHASLGDVLILQVGLYTGLLFMLLISFGYFFQIRSNKIKSILTTIANPARIRYLIPYDNIDNAPDILPASSYLTGRMRVKKLENILPNDNRLVATVMRQHHSNAIFATILAYLVLLLLGHFIHEPLLRFPAAVSFMLVFAIGLGLIGAVKYFLRSWETLGWALFILAIFGLVQFGRLDLRSEATGINYKPKTQDSLPAYNYKHLKNLYNSTIYNQDLTTDSNRLNAWQSKLKGMQQRSSPIIIYVSGGGSRSAYWSFRSLQYIDSMCGGKLFDRCVLISGASGGMIGAAYWRNLQLAYREGKIKNPYDKKYQDNIGKDILNAILFSLTTRDLISPFNKLNFTGKSYSQDRGNAMEEQMTQNTDSIIHGNFGDFEEAEGSGKIPALIVNATIINDGRRLIMSGQPLSFLCRDAATLQEDNPLIDAVDIYHFLGAQQAKQLHVAAALRINATFPYILPVVKLPSEPEINVMDAGLRDNFGMEIACRYVSAQSKWLNLHTEKIIMLQIRDTKDYEMHQPAIQDNFAAMVADPAFVIQDKWEIFQSYNHGYLKTFANQALQNKICFVKFQYYPQENDETAELNFHLTQKEKEDIYESTGHPANQEALKVLLNLLH